MFAINTFYSVCHILKKFPSECKAEQIILPSDLAITVVLMAHCVRLSDYVLIWYNHSQVNTCDHIRYVLGEVQL